MGTLFEKIPQLYQDESEKYAKLVVENNPKLVKAYLNGKSALGELTKLAMVESKGSLNPAFVAEYIVKELELLRGK